MSKRTKKKILPKTVKSDSNVQIPVEVLCHENLDAYCVVVFAYMKLRYQFFNDHLKTSFHESNSTIADAVGLSRSKVISCIDKLIEAGFVTKKTRNVVGVSKTEQTNIYTVTDCLRKKKISNTDNLFNYDGDEDPF